jgi:hypothetical protein
MPTILRFVHNAQGIGQLMGSAGVKADLEARAHRVWEQVTSETDLPTFLEDHSSWNRARYRVGIDSPLAKRLEAKHRILGRAMDAAR